MLKVSINDSSSRIEVLGAISLPGSLIHAMVDKEAMGLGMWFSLHRTANLFPLSDISSEYDSVSTPVISATLGGDQVEDLEEAVYFTLRLLNQVCVCVRGMERGREGRKGYHPLVSLY